MVTEACLKCVFFLFVFCQKQAESQVPKKKKKAKKSTTDGNDSGVEVYFREEEDKEDEKEPQPDSVNVSEYAAAQYFYCHTILQRFGNSNIIIQNLENKCHLLSLNR